MAAPLSSPVEHVRLVGRRKCAPDSEKSGTGVYPTGNLRRDLPLAVKMDPDEVDATTTFDFAGLPDVLQLQVCTHVDLASVRALRFVCTSVHALVVSSDFRKAWRALNQVESTWQQDKKKFSKLIAEADDFELETEPELPNHPPPPLPPPPPAAPAPEPEAAPPVLAPSTSAASSSGSSSADSDVFSFDAFAAAPKPATAQKRKRRASDERQAAASQFQRLNAFFLDVDQDSLEVEQVDSTCYSVA